MRRSRKLQLANTGIFHKMWKGHNGFHVLHLDREKAEYLNALGDNYRQEIADRVQWHSYCIMGNHPHEVGRALGAPGIDLEESVGQLGNWMRSAHGRFGASYNRWHRRRGKVSCERPKTVELDDELGVLQCMFYGDANPVRAGMVSHPSKYKWSSYHFYAFGKAVHQSEHFTPPPAYLALGKTAEERQKMYRRLCDIYLRKLGLIDDAPDEEGDSNSPEEAWLLGMTQIAVNDKTGRGDPP